MQAVGPGRTPAATRRAIERAPGLLAGRRLFTGGFRPVWAVAVDGPGQLLAQALLRIAGLKSRSMRSRFEPTPTPMFDFPQPTLAGRCIAGTGGALYPLLDKAVRVAQYTLSEDGTSF